METSEFYSSETNSKHNQGKSVTTPGKIIRKLSHSKIVVHFPKICDVDKEHKSYAHIDVDSEDVPPQMKDLKGRLLSLSFGKYLGLMLALLTSITMSLMTLFVKMLPDYHPFSLVLWRLQGVFLPSAVLISFLRCGRGDKIFNPLLPVTAPGKLTLLIIFVGRGIFGCSADTFQYMSLKYLSLADSSVVAFSTPIFVTFVAYFTLGEKLGIVPILAGIMSLIGVVVISRPPMLTGEESFNKDILIGNGFALGCMMMSTLTFISLRKLRELHFSLCTFSFGFIGTIQTSILCWTVLSGFEVPEGSHDIGLVITIAVMNLLGQLFFTMALQLEEAGPVSLVRSCDVIFAFIWQYLFLGVIPDIFSIIGGSIVISGVLVTALRKFVLELPEKDPRRQKLKLLLK